MDIIQDSKPRGESAAEAIRGGTPGDALETVDPGGSEEKELWRKNRLPKEKGLPPKWQAFDN